ncbi:molecular chaperone TorD [Vibrio cyclitrophicus]|uniref:molecular chaperone TorD n=1 Tax=Vibrio cyclitrophicus TaxID=47951 RepID=UPI0002E5C4B2|nr:molecular chaperone TorD [Vibrio cyclitrophicus]OED60562.1 molecular chaperone TorD [Vibrio cyclitrophicus ZF99]OEF36266.1 molecular chaperone TorD [Vibrio cyclitrophicus 1F289]PME20897.1 molecular chaperone TorD [Vibrio cyclitrophicus]PME54475.1 molecular chaperone TorD [Vibrio cyclitrophicus]PME72070.1 molecular chaperone TorD [Vibrio cyclitrophicus]
MKDTKAFNEQRAEIYWWLSSLFAKELTQEELDHYHSVEIRSFLSGLGSNEALKPSIDKLVDALNRLQTREDAQLELSADFCDLFLKTDKHGALPYASMYIGETGLLNDKPAKDMEDIMAKHNLIVNQGLKEPADHIAIELDFLGNLIIRSNETELEEELEKSFVIQQQFIEQQLLTWLPKFNVKCHDVDQFGFYASVSSLLLAFCNLDTQYLAGE